MSEPVADHVPPLPSLPTDRLDVDATAAQAVDLGATGDPTPAPVASSSEDGRPGPSTRAQRRTQAEAATSRRGRSSAQDSSVLDHPAMLVGLSVLALVALVIGVDQASQGTVVALLPAALLVAAYVVVVVRRRRARR